MKMKFLPEGLVFSSDILGIKAAERANGGTVCPSTRDKLKDICSTLLQWDDEQFVEVEVSRQYCLLMGSANYHNFLNSNLFMN
jgi:hypothetical protein